MSIGGLVLGLLRGAAFVWRPTGKGAWVDRPPPATGTVPDVAHEPAAAGAPRFSVIVPTYNRGPLVVEAIESVLTQRAGDFELIVVDDGSTDDTGRRLGRIHDRRLRRLNLPHRGAAAARNAGIAAGSGSLVAFLDSDDLWKPDKLEQEADFLARHPEVGVVFSDLEKVDRGRFTPSFMRTTEVFSRRLRGGPAERVLSMREIYLCLLQEAVVKTPALTVRRRILDSVGGFDERWHSSEDWELLFRLAQATPFGYLDRPLAVIRVSPDSLHRVEQEHGDRRMLQLLAAHLRAAPDAEVRAAARRGIRGRARHLAWHHLDAGRRAAAAAICLRWGLALPSAELLARAVAGAVRAPRRTA
jgi:glycosyltransferase involved in cell wall biosynthesis